MPFSQSPATAKKLAVSLLLIFGVCAGATDISTTPLSTYAITSATDIKPNVMFVLDDSGSMDWDYMPDWANDNSPPDYRTKNPSFNGLAYNPAVTYTPPVAVTSAGVTNTTTYLNMTGTGSTTGGSNWNAVKNDAYGVQSTSTTSLTPSSSRAPYFYTTVAGEYCTSASLRSCTTASAPTTVSNIAYNFPSKLSWCNSSGLSTCKAGFESGSYSNARMPSPRTASFTISGSSNTSVGGITVGGLQIMSGATSTYSNSTDLAAAIVTKISECTFVIPSGSTCETVGYTASNNNGTVTITSPTATSAVPSVTKTGSMTFSTPSAFAIGSVPGENLRTTITPSITAYTYPGTNTRANTRSDCASATACTYAEEMTNYANWWTYYRTRMQMMKTATSNAFSTLDTAADVTAGNSKYRVGFMTINNNNNTDFVNLNEFKSTQKGTWYSKLINANPSNSTPLRRALADVGRLYGGNLNGQSLNGVTVIEPLQYSCQRNYTILSTDGFWNSGAGYKLDGSTAVGNQDAGLAAPYGDGGTATLQIRTSKLQQATAVAQNQFRISNLQSRTTTTYPAPSIQQKTSTNGGNTWTSTWQDVSSCTSKKNQVMCQYPESDSSDSGVTWTPWYYTNKCTVDTTKSSRTMCSGSFSTSTNWANVSSCTTGSGVECRYDPPFDSSNAFANTTSNAACTAVAQSPSSPFTVAVAKECRQIAGTTGTYSDVTSGNSCVSSATNSCQYTGWTNWQSANSCTAAPQSSSPTYTQLTATQCQSVATGGNSDNLADVAAYYYNTDLRTSTPANAADATGPCTSPAGDDLCANNIVSSGKDVAKTQHMTTFTLGLGAQGKMIYAPQTNKDYWQDTSGDFFSVANRKTAGVPDSSVCSWQSSGLCYWPTPASDSNANIDDLWHAAINGHGTYFSASDAPSLAESLTGALGEIVKTPRAGTAAAAASSNPNVTTTDNYVFSSSYISYKWIGELIRQEITASGTLNPQNWSAKVLLDCSTTPWVAGKNYKAGNAFRVFSALSNSNTCYLVKTDYSSGSTFNYSSTGLDFLNTTVVNANEYPTPVDGVTPSKVPVVPKTSRTIFTNSATALVDFTFSTLPSNLSDSFTKSYLTSRLSQFCASGSTCLTDAEKTAASEAALVDYLRGVRTNEATYFRTRENVLGDIVSSEAKYVKAPLENYTDAGFAAFKTAQATRVGTVYVGANDGMLHSFDGTTGQENWAYIPAAVVPNLYQLADKNYDTHHQYYVDGSPEVGDVYGPCRPATTLNPTPCTGSEWRTILVSGLNRGGTSYYALDITNPADPIFLWEISESSMGYSYGNPKITKLKDGTWVVLLASGYNNSDTKGYLYVRNALSGTSVRTIATATIGELGHINARALTPDTNNTAVAAYGGDTQGNLWRFDINGDIGVTGFEAHKLITLKDAAGKNQAITAKPEIATVNGVTMVYVGTGMYLGVGDITNSDYQSFYGVIDRNDDVTLVTPRGTDSKFIKQTLTDTTCPSGSNFCIPGQNVRTSTSASVDWTLNNGWYIDFLGAGERSVTDPSLALGTLLFTTILPAMATTGSPTCGETTGNAAGGSFLYALDYKTGGAVTGSKNVAGVSLGPIIATRPVPIELSDGTIVTITRGTPPEGKEVETTINKPTIGSTASSGVRRVSWRELTTQ